MRYIILEPCAYPEAGHNIESCLRFARKLEKEKNHIAEFWVAGSTKKISSNNYKVSKINKLYIQLFEERFSAVFVHFVFRSIIKVLQIFGGSFLDYLLINVAKNNLKKKYKRENLI